MDYEEDNKETLSALACFFLFKKTKQNKKQTHNLSAFALLNCSNQEHFISASSLTASFEDLFPLGLAAGLQVASSVPS